MLVTRGTLRKGCVVVAGLSWAKVRSLFDEDQHVMEQVMPGMPAQVIGWRTLPSAGDLLLEVTSEVSRSVLCISKYLCVTLIAARKEASKCTLCRCHLGN